MIFNVMSNINGLNITDVNNKNLCENQEQLANDLKKQKKSTLSTIVSSNSESFSLITMSLSSNSIYR